MNKNTKKLWLKHLPCPGPDSNKYSRGHAVVIGGPISCTGASRLAAHSALRSGAGLVTMACSSDTLPIYACTLTAVMTKPFDNNEQLIDFLHTPNIKAILAGPGNGVSRATFERTLAILNLGKPCVLDADAISVFENNEDALFSAIQSPTIITPHWGEFSRIFTTTGSREVAVTSAAKKSGAIIVLKGSDSIIAAPDGRCVVNTKAPAWLATAGSGDVLAGIITGLLAQGMPAFEAACCGVWIHSRAAQLFGPGLISEDIPDKIPEVLSAFFPRRDP